MIRNRRQIVFGVGAGVISTGVDGLVGLSNIHFFFKYLPETVVGFWLVSVTIGGFLMLAQSAITPVIARFTAQQTTDFKNLTGRYAGIRWLTHQLILVLVLVGLLAYLAYLRPVGREQHFALTAAASWFSYCLGLICALDASSRFAVLNGLGEVGWDKVTRIGTSTIGGLLTWISLRVGFGLLGLGLTFLLQSLVTLVLSEYLLRRQGGRDPGAKNQPSAAWIHWFKRGKTVKEIGIKVDPTHRRQLLVETGKLLGLALISYTVLNFGTLVIERRFGPEAVSKFAPLLRIGTLLAAVASLIPQMLYPFIARAWADGHYHSHRRLFLGGLSLAAGTYLVGSLIVWFSAPVLVPLWLGPGRYLGPKILGLILLNYGLQVANVAISSPVLASVGDALLGPSVLTLGLVLPLVWFFSGWLGMTGAPLGMLVATAIPSIWLFARARQIMLQHGREDGTLGRSRSSN